VKVVLFCGGLGLRMGEATIRTPKPLVHVGGRPIVWYIMKYYAHYGHSDFVLCLGHHAEAIKSYFLTYNEALANDFTWSNGGQLELARRDMAEWRITFVDTGLHSNIGERLRRVRPHLEGDEIFLAHYGDTLTDAPLPELIRELDESGTVASFLSARPSSYTFHMVDVGDGHLVTSIRDVDQADVWINGGYFVLRKEIFDYMQPGEELVKEPFQRLIQARQLMTHRHHGFWAPMDTLKDRQNLEILAESGNPPWVVWESETDPDHDRPTGGSSLDGRLVASTTRTSGAGMPAEP
jgi:glucose-1-phosphate cytidylyltransferase